MLYVYSNNIDSYKKKQKNISDYYLDIAIPKKSVFDAQNLLLIEKNMLRGCLRIDDETMTAVKMGD